MSFSVCFTVAVGRILLRNWRYLIYLYSLEVCRVWLYLAVTISCILREELIIGPQPCYLEWVMWCNICPWERRRFSQTDRPCAAVSRCSPSPWEPVSHWTSRGGALFLVCLCWSHVSANYLEPQSVLRTNLRASVSDVMTCDIPTGLCVTVTLVPWIILSTQQP
jgi:hypothetical protein